MRLFISILVVGLACYCVAQLAPCDGACMANNECSPTDPPDHTHCPRCDLRSNTCQKGFKCGCRCTVNTDCDQTDQNTTCAKCFDVDPDTRIGTCRNEHCNFGCTSDEECAVKTFGSCPKCIDAFNPGQFLCRPDNSPPPDDCGGAPPPPPPPSECSYNLDNIFLMDASGSISSASWRIERQCVLKVGQNFTFGSNKNQSEMGIIQFSKRAHMVQHITPNANLFFQTLQTMVRISGSTNTGEAFNQAAREFDQHGRPNGYRTVVLLTDGRPNTGPNPITAANNLKAKDVRIFAVAVGKWNTAEIQKCASKPLSHFFYSVSSWGALPGTLHKLVENMCNRTAIDEWEATPQF